MCKYFCRNSVTFSLPVRLVKGEHGKIQDEQNILLRRVRRDAQI